MSAEPSTLFQLKQIASGRSLPRDRMEAALFGYTEEEWQEMVATVQKAGKVGNGRS